MMNPYQQYKEASLTTMASGEILVKLFDEALLQLRQAKISLEGEEKDLFRVNESLNKVQAILDALNASLDMQFEISQQLRPLYVFVQQQIMQANVKKNVQIIDEMVPLLRDLRDTFDQAEKLSRQSQRAAATAGKAV